MPDNVSITPGTGVSVASDDIGSVQYQRLKLAMGPDGTWSGDAQTPTGDALAASTLLATGVSAFNGTTFDRLRTSQAFTSASATPTVGALATIAPDFRYSAVNLATAANSAQSWDTTGMHSALVRVGTTTTGTFTFEVSADGTNWVAAEVMDTQNALWVGGTNLTPTSGRTYLIATNGWNSVRARTVTTLGTTVSLLATLTESEPFSTPDMVAPPHALGYNWVARGGQYTTAQTSTALWTPTTGTRPVVTAYHIQVYGTTAGTLQLYTGTGAFNRGGTNNTRAIFDGEFAPSATLKPGVVLTGVFPAVAANDAVRVTTSAAMSVTVSVWGYEAS